ncbi:MAG: L-seryl-tRNA(Sec) selenium transferase [Gemmatimonadota bacterium]|nr:L-seryl-tRNA(Sec) selenium transferase [Gemmatimonadota bacterium]
MKCHRNALRRIPSVDRVLGAPVLHDLLRDEPRPLVLRFVRAHLEGLRARILSGDMEPTPSPEEVAADIARRVRERPRGLARVLNATGVVLHTNLGRARLAPEAVEAVLEAAGGACDLEFDLETGRRSRRGVHVEERLVEVSGFESALVVNNNAGGLVLALNELSQGREAIVSRGELVEIGGSFRIPDVMARTGARLVEVGTTNRTHLADYEQAIGPDTAVLVKVHRSNFRQEGFVSEPTLAELVEVGRHRGVPVLHDLGSGLLRAIAGAESEPTLAESLAAGVDLVAMSGDKLLGGPQAGILLGRRELVDRLRGNPLARALRVDKMTLAALAATLDLLEDGDRAVERVPTLRSLVATPAELESRASWIAEGLSAIPGMTVRTMPGLGEVGGGAVPARGLPTTMVGLSLQGMSARNLAEELRRMPLPVVARIVDEEVLLDPRSLDPGEDAECVRAVAEWSERRGG